jgi:hypothetical protein
MRELERWGVSVGVLGGRSNAAGLPREGLWLCAIASLLCAVALVAPAAADARDLVVYGEPALEKALKSVGSLWQARTGTRVNVFITVAASVRLCVGGKFCRSKSCATLMASTIMRSELMGDKRTPNSGVPRRTNSSVFDALDFDIYTAANLAPMASGSRASSAVLAIRA